MARVAIITRTKDRSLLLERAIRSVLAQTVDDWVHVIVNDAGKVDDLERLCSKYGSAYRKRLRLVHRTQSSGIEAASNAGIRASHSDTILMHDDDDTIHPQFLAKTLAVLDGAASAPNWCGVVTHSALVHEKIEGSQIIELDRIPFNEHLESVDLSAVLLRNRYPNVSFLFKRSVYDEVGGFDEQLPVLGDWDFNLKLLQRYDIFLIRETLAFYHLRRGANPGALTNTIYDHFGLHQQWESSLRNRYLRRDLEAGKFGVGSFMAAEVMLRMLGDGLQRKFRKATKKLDLLKILSRFTDR